MAKRIFTYKDTMVDLSKVSTIEMDEDDMITFCMDGDWEYEINVDKKDIRDVKMKLIELFNS